MAISLIHTKRSEKADGQDDSLLQPSHWNAEHTFTAPAKTLIGNSDDSPGPVKDISLGTGLELDEVSGELIISGADSIVVTDATDFPDARVLTNTATVTWDKATANQVKGNVPDGGITPAKLQNGVQGDIIHYGAGGVAARLPIGPPGSFLKTGTAAVVGPPAVAATDTSWAFTGAPHAVLRDKKANGTVGGAFDQGVWADRVLNDKLYDTYGFVTLAATTLANAIFTLTAGTYVIEWSAPAFKVGKHQTRLLNFTVSPNVVIEYGSPEYSGGTTAINYAQTRSTGIANVTVASAIQLKLQHRCNGDTGETNNFGVPGDFESVALPAPYEIYSIVKIWRVA